MTLRRRARLSQVSLRRAAQARERRAVVDEALRRANFVCEAEKVWPEIRCHGGLDAHERVQRSLRPGGELDLDNVVVLCASHHRAVHDHVALAHRRGLLRRSWE